MTRRVLEAAYRRARYRVELASGPLELRVGEPAPELDRFLAARGARRWAFLTAVNPGSVQLAEAENRRRLAELDRRLAAAGRESLPGWGLDPEGRWPPEPSRLLVDASEAEAAALAAEFGQAAFLAGEAGGPVRLLWVAADTAPTA